MVATPQSSQSSSGTRDAGHTRERVLDGALELFNRDGTTRVTTNHIAAHVGISPGNLYYWFRDKPQIIRALYERYAQAHSLLWDGLDPNDPGAEGTPGAGTAPGIDPEDLFERLAAATELSNTYRFLARDLLALVHSDPELMTTYRAVRDARLTAFRSLARHWRGTGVVRPMSDDDLDDVVDALWVVAEAWWPFAELGGPAGSRGASATGPVPEQGSRLLRAVLGPHLVRPLPRPTSLERP
ncbi:TetR/AcrR family transcriptional regulator [Cellulomonas hominis]